VEIPTASQNDVICVVPLKVHSHSFTRILSGHAIMGLVHRSLGLLGINQSSDIEAVQRNALFIVLSGDWTSNILHSSQGPLHYFRIRSRDIQLHFPFWLLPIESIYSGSCTPYSESYGRAAACGHANYIPL